MVKSLFPVINIYPAKAKDLTGETFEIINDHLVSDKWNIPIENPIKIDEMELQQKFKIGVVVFNENDTLQVIKERIWDEDGDAFLICGKEETGLFSKDSILKLTADIDRVWCPHHMEFHAPPRCSSSQ